MDDGSLQLQCGVVCCDSRVLDVVQGGGAGICKEACRKTIAHISGVDGDLCGGHGNLRLERGWRLP